MKKICVLLEQQYQEMEVWVPVYRLQEAGYEVVLVAPEAGKTYPSKLGYPAKSDAGAKAVSAKDFAGVVIPGGFSPDYIRRSEAMLKLVRDADELKLPIAAICHGPWVLCSTPSAIRGRTVTSFSSIQDDLVNAGAKWVDQEVAIDGHIITSRTPADLPAFLKAFLAKLG